MSRAKIDRRAFLAQCKALGLGLPWLPLLLESCAEEVGGQYSDFQVDFSGKIIVVGAGACGLAAGYLLARYGIDFEIIEAASDFGGRVKRASDFADFPIDVGAEWIHQDPAVLAALIDDRSVEGSIDVLPYSPDTVYTWRDGRLHRVNFGGNYYNEYKFKSTTWYGFLEDYIAPSSLDRITYDSAITRVEYGDSGVTLTDVHGAQHQADRVLVTAPITVLRSGSIEFVPGLPEPKTDVLARVQVPDGIKVFIEFSEKFYPDILSVGGLFADDAQEKTFYDAAFRKDSNRNILGLFCIGDQASVYAGLETEQEIIDTVLAELDEMLGGRASPAYVKHIIQHWTKEPYILGAYTTGFGGSEESAIRALREPLDDRVFFAGEALSTDNGATVPGAMESAYAVIETMLRE